jgi:cytoskeletal protein CcmA (bactofilin family)
MNSNDGSTVIGKSVVVRGELSGNEDLYLDGDLEGTITLTESRLTIGPNARVVADLKVRDLVVLGNLKGNVHASGRIELRKSAVVSGDIFASRLSIEESAVIQGRVELITAVASTAASAGSGSSTSVPNPTSAPFVLEPKL